MPAEALILALLRQLVRRGDFTADDIGIMADELESDGEHDAARFCRAAYAEAIAPDQSEWAAQQARQRFRVIAPDGGKAPG